MEKSIAQKANHDFKNGPFQMFDDNGNEIYYERSNGFWSKRKYESNNKVIYFETSYGYWIKTIYDGDEIHYEDSNEYRAKCELAEKQ